MGILRHMAELDFAALTKDELIARLRTLTRFERELITATKELRDV